jgi:hypothetical protein
MLQQRLRGGCPVVVDEREVFGEQADVAGDCQILPERQDGPEDDVTV